MLREDCKGMPPAGNKWETTDCESSEYEALKKQKDARMDYGGHGIPETVENLMKRAREFELQEKYGMARPGSKTKVDPDPMEHINNNFNDCGIGVQVPISERCYDDRVKTELKLTVPCERCVHNLGNVCKYIHELTDYIHNISNGSPEFVVQLEVVCRYHLPSERTR